VLAGAGVNRQHEHEQSRAPRSVRRRRGCAYSLHADADGWIYVSRPAVGWLVAALRSPAALSRAAGQRPRLLPLSAVRPIVKVPMVLHERVAVLPGVALVAAVGMRIARSQVLAICVRIELRTVARVGDCGLRKRRGCGCCRGKRGGANQCESHLGLLEYRHKNKIGIRGSCANELSVGPFKRDDSAPMVQRSAVVVMHGLPRRHFADQQLRYRLNSM
jgi:hypothetical protein